MLLAAVDDDLAAPSALPGWSRVRVAVPSGFVTALHDDIRAKRGLTDLPPELARAAPADIAAWLADRSHSLAGAPDLGPWL